MYRVKLALLFKLIKVGGVLVPMINYSNVLIFFSIDYGDINGEITCAVAQ